MRSLLPEETPCSLKKRLKKISLFLLRLTHEIDYYKNDSGKPGWNQLIHYFQGLIPAWLPLQLEKAGFHPDAPHAAASVASFKFMNNSRSGQWAYGPSSTGFLTGKTVKGALASL